MDQSSRPRPMGMSLPVGTDVQSVRQRVEALEMLLERSFQAQFLVPMAVSISFGLVAATILTLLFVPSLYMIVYEITQGWRQRRQRAITGKPPAAEGDAAGNSPAR